ncbi:MAG UNVERIFIED_CONTAM: hypothetical protein LVR29_06440 [Microcystis novacekii LVE1205-3]|jgi:hypothetical protein
MNPTTANYDEPWKEALTEYFEAFLYFFFPEVHQLIDWTRKRVSEETRFWTLRQKNVSLTNSIQLSVISYQLSVTNWKQVAIPLL